MSELDRKCQCESCVAGREFNRILETITDEADREWLDKYVNWLWAVNADNEADLAWYENGGRLSGEKSDNIAHLIRCKDLSLAVFGQLLAPHDRFTGWQNSSGEPIDDVLNEALTTLRK